MNIGSLYYSDAILCISISRFLMFFFFFSFDVPHEFPTLLPPSALSHSFAPSQNVVRAGGR